ncbi:MAG: alpha/beta fold hydrolase [Candidatus Promineifilaceae bacterium]
MQTETPTYAELIETWGKLWQSGFAAVWQGYQQWCQSVQVFSLGRSLVGQTPARQVWNAGRVKLIRYVPTTATQCSVPVLFVPSLINRYYILDLLPERSLIKYLVSRGLNVYLLDWGRPTPADACLTLDDHLSHYLHEAVEAVQEDSGIAPISLLGYCMGGMFTAVYTSLYPERVRSMVNLAGPISYHDDGIFSLLTRSAWFDPDKLVQTYGNIPADLLCWTFQMLRPTSHLARALYLYENMDNDDYVRSYAAMQTWIFDQVDFPGEAFRRYIKAFYQENQLVKGNFTVNGRAVKLDNIRCPLLNISSEHDETAPHESVKILNDLVSSQENDRLVLKGPHVGMVAGSKAPKYLWPQLADWLVAHNN